MNGFYLPMAPVLKAVQGYLGKFFPSLEIRGNSSAMVQVGPTVFQGVEDFWCCIYDANLAESNYEL